jgi:hypothetical protein
MRRDEAKARGPAFAALSPAEACNIHVIQHPYDTRKGMTMPSEIVESAERDYHEEVGRELEEERYTLALKRLTVSDVLSEVDHLIADQPDERRHPLFALARHGLQSGGYRSTGQRAHLAELVSAKFEDLIDIAIERLVQEELASGVSWGD